MGQKVSPVSMRLGVNRDFQANWYADKKDFAKLLNEDIKIRKYLETQLKEAALSKVEILRAKLVSAATYASSSTTKYCLSQAVRSCICSS